MADYETKKIDPDMFVDSAADSASGESDTSKEMRKIVAAVEKGCNSLAVEPIFGEGDLADVMCVASADGNIYAVDARKGEIIWKFRTGGPVSATSVVHKNILYEGSFDHNFYAIDMQTGSERWHFRTGDVMIGKPLLLSDRIVFASYDNHIYAVSYDGRELWRVRLNGFSLVDMLYLDGKIFVGATDGKLYAMDAESRILWSYFAGSTAVGSSAFVKETKSIVFVTMDGYIHNIKDDGKLLWKYKCDGTFGMRDRPQVKDGVIFVSAGDFHSGAVYALDARRGSLVWKFTTYGRVCMPKLLNGLLFCPSWDKNLYALDTSGKLLWKFQADGPLGSVPTLHNGLIYQCSYSGHLYCLDESGSVVWKIFFPGQPANVEKVFSPVQQLSDRLRSIVRFWKPEAQVKTAYDTKIQPQLTLGPAAYRMSEPYKSDVKYVSKGPYETMQEKKRDWRDLAQGKK